MKISKYLITNFFEVRWKQIYIIYRNAILRFYFIQISLLTIQIEIIACCLSLQVKIFEENLEFLLSFSLSGLFLSSFSYCCFDAQSLFKKNSKELIKALSQNFYENRHFPIRILYSFICSFNPFI